MFWSCKIKRPDGLKRHRTFEVAAKRVGERGFVYSELDGTVQQVFKMIDGSLTGYDVDKQPEYCNTEGFDMRKALSEFGIVK
jgi:hypothetical protein